MKEDVKLPGIPDGPPTPEEIKANQEKVVEEKKQIIADLNKIKYPLNVTVLSHHGPWTIRNTTFWEMLKKRDKDVVEYMEKFLTNPG